MNMKEYDREVNRRLCRNRMRKVGHCIDGHAWTHWAIGLVFWVAFFALVEAGYSAAHDGQEFGDALLDWLGAPKAEVTK